ncbi:MAG: hypothetical protein JOZ86_15700 [Candidatus Eremiobacteraeota bacterium]|nr:hypothetical protein [Candidatus Eremiobacteraeota bacterium]
MNDVTIHINHPAATADGAAVAANAAAAVAILPDDPDVDEPWYVAAKPEQKVPQNKNAAALSLSDTLTCGQALLAALNTNLELRLQYYNISRTWHKAQNGGTGGGEFGQQWLALLNKAVPQYQSQNLNTNDFANLHRYVFFTLRRTMLAITGHDVDPDSVATATSTTRSFHWVPNDSSAAGGTFSTVELGLSDGAP